MTDATDNAFTPDRLLEQAQGNATALALVSIAYMKDRGLSPDEYVAFIGHQFAVGWEELRGRPINDVAHIVALNLVSLGATVQTLSGNATRAELVIAGWPKDEALAAFNLTRQDSNTLWTIFQPIMDYVGIQYAWQPQNDVVRITLTHADRS